MTYDELTDMLPDDADIPPEKIDDILMMLDELGVDLIDETEIENRDIATETEEAEPYPEYELEIGEVPTITEKIDDPVRMYLTQMGEIPLLTREEEIMLAKESKHLHVLYLAGAQTENDSIKQSEKLLNTTNKHYRTVTDRSNSC